MVILITGGTGLIGTELSKMLTAKGHEVRHLSRKSNPDAAFKTFIWDIEKQYIEPQAFENVEAIVHLAGAGIADERWSEKRKKEIIDSRTKPIELIVNYLKNNTHQIKTFVSASAIGYYGGETGDVVIDEYAAAGNDFLAEVTKQWESATNTLNDLGLRVCKIRVGVVLSNKSGALPKMIQPIKWGVGSALGSGKQWISWVHIHDLCALFIEAIENETMQGIYNGVAPVPSRNETLIKEAAKQLKMPLWLPNVPTFALNMLLGEMAIIVAGGNYVISKRLADETTFAFQFPTLESALENLLGAKKE